MIKIGGFRSGIRILRQSLHLQQGLIGGKTSAGLTIQTQMRSRSVCSAVVRLNPAPTGYPANRGSGSLNGILDGSTAAWGHNPEC